MTALRDLLAALDWGSLQRNIGPSPEEQAVIDAAVAWRDSIVELGMSPRKGKTGSLLAAIEAMKEGK